MKRVLIYSAFLALSSVAACSSDDATPAAEPATGTTTGDDGNPAPDDSNDPVETPPEDVPEAFDPAEWSVFEAGPFTVPAGQERFFCYSHTLEEDLVVSEIAIQSRPVVHHVVYSATSSPDPEGFFECDVLFQNNWIPVFVAGTGDASLAMPEGAGHVLARGTQLTVQLHLLNATPEEVTETLPVGLRRMDAEAVDPVRVAVFGSLNIALPPNQTSEVVSQCESDSDMHLFSAFPHMHYLGQGMVVEAGPSADELEEIFRRDPYDFDDQSLGDLDVSIKAGDTVRVTCTYDNTLDQTVTFGESSTSEMCFFIAFATEATHDLAGCIGGSSGTSLFPAECGQDEPNDIGLGAACTHEGGECAEGLVCTEDFDQISGPQTCIGFGCETSADCGEGGICCAVAAAGGATICLPPSCQTPVCTPVD